VNSAPDWMIDREDGELFDMARAVLAAGDDLDALLDSVPNMDVDSISAPTEIDGEAVPAVATVSVYDDVWREPSAKKVGSYTGTGPTRREALQNAVEKAKERK